MRLQVTSFYNGLPDGLIYYELIEYFQTSIVWPVNMIFKRMSGDNFHLTNEQVIRGKSFVLKSALHASLEITCLIRPIEMWQRFFCCEYIRLFETLFNYSGCFQVALLLHILLSTYSRNSQQLKCCMEFNQAHEMFANLNLATKMNNFPVILQFALGDPKMFNVQVRSIIRL